MKAVLAALGVALATATVASAQPVFETRLLGVSAPGVPVQAAIGDVDADGRNELVVVTTPSEPLRIFAVAGDGTATLERSVALAATSAHGFSFAQPRIVDADGDGDRDIALYLRRDGAPGVLQLVTFTGAGYSVSAFAMPETDAAYGFDMADVNGDGVADAVTANHGANAPPTIFVTYGGSFTQWSEHPLPSAQRGVTFVYARDLDADNRVDLVAASAPHNNFAARIFRNGAAGFTVQDLAGPASSDLTIADQTGDGRLDIIATSDTSEIRIFRGSAFTTISRLNTPPAPRSPVVADFNADGRRDIVTVQPFNRYVRMVLGGSGGAIALITPELSAADYREGQYAQLLSMGDVDNDGNADLVFASDRVILIRHRAADTTPPVIRSVSATPHLLSPPNHKMVAVAITVDATDNVDRAPVARIVRVTSNEAPNGKGDGNTSSDWTVTGPLTLELRSERSGKGDGRVYTITIEVRDRAGNASTATASVRVQ